MTAIVRSAFNYDEKDIEKQHEGSKRLSQEDFSPAVRLSLLVEHCSGWAWTVCSLSLRGWERGRVVPYSGSLSPGHLTPFTLATPHHTSNSTHKEQSSRGNFTRSVELAPSNELPLGPKICNGKGRSGWSGIASPACLS